MNEYITISVVWSVFYFVLGYIIAKTEVAIRKRLSHSNQKDR